MLNALSVDVEEYFQVANFFGAISRDSWDSRARRADKITKNLLDLFDQHDAKATFFVLGWLAEREPELVREIAAPVISSSNRLDRCVSWVKTFWPCSYTRLWL